MPYVNIDVSGRSYKINCQAGQEEQLHAASALFNNEVRQLASQTGRMPESLMLLMTGLILADKIKELESGLKQAELSAQQLEKQLKSLEANNMAATSHSANAPEVIDMLEAISVEAEQLAQAIENIGQKSHSEEDI